MCRRVGEEYDSTIRTKTTIDRTATIMATTTPLQKQNSNWRRYRRLDNENKRPSWRQKQKDNRSNPHKLLIERVEGNYSMTIDQRTATKAPTKMTKVQRVDDGNVSKRRCWQVVSTRTRCKVFVFAHQQELLYGGTRTSQQYSTETRNHSTDTPQIAQKVPKVHSGCA